MCIEEEAVIDARMGTIREAAYYGYCQSLGDPDLQIRACHQGK